MREIGRRGMDFSVNMITAMPDPETAAESVRLGAFDYLSKPV